LNGSYPDSHKQGVNRWLATKKERNLGKSSKIHPVMKFQFRFLFAALALVCFGLGCQTTEQYFTKNEGIWDVASHQIKTFNDDVLQSDTTMTANLGQYIFEISGQGFRIDGAGVRDTFTWSLNRKDDKITMYLPGQFADAKIDSKNKDDMTLHWNFSQGVGPVLVKKENILKLKRF
jgi:hypothetical protein